MGLYQRQLSRSTAGIEPHIRHTRKRAEKCFERERERKREREREMGKKISVDNRSKY